VAHVGLCGSDLNTFSGRNPLATLPLIPGHEISGTIVALGDGVDPAIKPDMPAIVIPYLACGACSACRARRPNACRNNRTLGVQRDGGMAEYIALPADRVIVNDTLSSPLRALVEPLAVGFHAVRRAAVKPGQLVAVIGGGMIGMGAIIGAMRRGARVAVIEVSEIKRQTIEEFGVESFINPTVADVPAEIASLSGGEGADVVIEAVGLPETFRSAVDYASYAGQVVYLGYAKDHVEYDTKYFNLKELNILGSRNATREDFDEVIAYLEEDGDRASSLISRVFPWTEADQAFQFWDDLRSEVFKIMIEIDHD
jgi:threonine dehydrogenase-like Zn-dependent dehydrogenase